MVTLIQLKFLYHSAIGGRVQRYKMNVSKAVGRGSSAAMSSVDRVLDFGSISSGSTPAAPVE